MCGEPQSHLSRCQGQADYAPVPAYKAASADELSTDIDSVSLQTSAVVANKD